LSAVNSSPNFFSTGTFNSFIGDGSKFFTLTVNNCEYTTIGNMIFASIWLQWSSKGSTSGNILVALPAAINAVSWLRLCGTVGFCTGVTYSNQLILTGSSSNAYMAIYDANKSGGSPTALTNTSFSTNGIFQANG